jgi:hypothetical protein
VNTASKKRAYFATVPPQEILPIVDGEYESSVKGLFVIGDVTGLPLVKVAANQGREVIERMEKGGLLKTSEDQEGLDLVIVGGGPAGISAAIECEKRHLKYVLLERTSLANTVRTFPSGKKFTPNRRQSRTLVTWMLIGTWIEMTFFRSLKKRLPSGN